MVRTIDQVLPSQRDISATCIPAVPHSSENGEHNSA